MDQYTNGNPSYYYSASENENRESVGRYTAKTYLWMFLGLMITAGLGALLSYSGLLVRIIISAPAIIYVLPLLEIVLVIVLAARIQKLSVGAAISLFLIYAVLNAFTFAVVFLAYEVSSAILLFAAAALLFGIMGAWGYITKQDLSSWRKVLMIGLIALVVVGILSIFLDLSAAERIISFVGVLVFLGFTAYDTQKIKAFYQFYSGDEKMLKKASIFSALQLYLDFINLFLYLLRLFGRRR